MPPPCQPHSEVEERGRKASTHSGTWGLKPRVAIQLYKSFIRAPMEYSILSWLPLLPSAHLRALERIQNSFLRTTASAGIVIASAVIRWGTGD